MTPRQWRSEILKFGIKSVDKGYIFTDSRFRSDGGITLETTASLSLQLEI